MGWNLVDEITPGLKPGAGADAVAGRSRARDRSVDLDSLGAARRRRYAVSE